MRVARANGVHIHFDEVGRADGPVLVLSNSLGTDFRVWDRVVERLGGMFRIVVYDKRGHGLSETTPAPYSIDDHVADLAALLDSLAVRDAILCGLSVGGVIAQGLAAARPELVRALVLCDTGHKVGTPEMWTERMAAIEAGGIEALAEPILERWFSSAFRATRPEEVAGWRAMLTRTPQAGYLGTCAALRDADLTETTRALALPTLCLCGSEDGATPPDLVRALAALIDGARFELIDGVGHLPCVEAAETVAGLISGFAEEHGLV